MQQNEIDMIESEIDKSSIFCFAPPNIFNSRGLRQSHVPGTSFRSSTWMQGSKYWSNHLHSNKKLYQKGMQNSVQVSQKWEAGVPSISNPLAKCPLHWELWGRPTEYWLCVMGYVATCMLWCHNWKVII